MERYLCNCADILPSIAWSGHINKPILHVAVALEWKMLRLCTPIVLGLLQVVGPVASQEIATLPVTYAATILQGGGERCPSDEQREAAKANISQALRALLRDVPVSLQDSGSYRCGGFGTGWARIVYFNMSELTQQCPQSWSLITSPKRTCGRTSVAHCSSPSVPCTCDSATFSNDQGIQYSEVCGRVVGYRAGNPEAFQVYSHLREDIDRAYAEGVSITHGSPRQHIWTLAGTSSVTFCPCDSSSSNSPPSFVGNDYFCEVGDPPAASYSMGSFYSNDPLWDGDGCGSSSTCCTFNNPPWFYKELPSPTTDGIEVRLCGDSYTADENFPIELIEIYIK